MYEHIDFTKSICNSCCAAADVCPIEKLVATVLSDKNFTDENYHCSLDYLNEHTTVSSDKILACDFYEMR